MDNSLKLQTYQELVQRRKDCRLCEGLVNPSVVANGALDCEHIGAWSYWQGDLNAKLMVVGQDWGDERYFTAHQGKDNPDGPTNRMLVELLRSVGFDLKPPPDPADSNGLFFTNAVLCLKQGGMQADMRRDWFEQCGSNFLLPLIEIIQPQVLVTLGAGAYRAVRERYDLKGIGFRGAVETPGGFVLPGGILLFPRYHCGARILNTHRKCDQQFADWSYIKQALDSKSAAMRLVRG